MVENLDGFAFADGLCEEHRCHVRASPGAVDREKAQAGHRDAVEFAVAVRQQFVALFGGCVEGDRTVCLVRFGVGDLGVQSVHRTRRRIDQMLHAKVAAGLEDVQEARQVAFQVGVGVGDGVAHPGLRRQVHHFVEALPLEQRVERGLVGDIHPHEAAGSAEFAQAALLEPHVIIVVYAVQAHDFVAAARETVHQFGADKSRSSGNQNFHPLNLEAMTITSRLWPSIFQPPSAWVNVMRSSNIFIARETGERRRKHRQPASSFSSM